MGNGFICTYVIFVPWVSRCMGLQLGVFPRAKPESREATARWYKSHTDDLCHTALKDTAEGTWDLYTVAVPFKHPHTISCERDVQ